MKIAQLLHTIKQDTTESLLSYCINASLVPSKYILQGNRISYVL